MPTRQEVQELLATDAKRGNIQAIGKAKRFDDARTWVDPKGHKLSDRVWDSRQATRTQMDGILREAVRTREDALVTSKKLEQFLNPAYALKRGPEGKILKGQPKGIVTQAPGRGGQGSYAARRLARTEISRAHAQETDRISKLTPFAIGQQWNISGSHPIVDECDAKADADNGLGPGIYAIGHFPRMPSHPHCLCYATIVTAKDDSAIIAKLRQDYGFDASPQLAQMVGETAAEAKERVRLYNNEASRRSKAKARAKAKGLPEPDLPPISGPPKFKPVAPETPVGVVPEQLVADRIATTQAKQNLMDFAKDEFNVVYHAAPDDLKILNTVNNALADLKARGHLPTEQIDIDFKTTGLGSATATISPWTARISLNIEGKFGDIWSGANTTILKDAFSTGWLSGSTATETLMHELAHFTHIKRLGSSEIATLSQKYLPPSLEKQIASEVSRYGAKNPVEFVAESYVKMARTGKPLSDNLMALYDEFDGPPLKFLSKVDDVAKETAERVAKETAERLVKEHAVAKAIVERAAERAAKEATEQLAKERARLARNEASRLSKQRAKVRATAKEAQPVVKDIEPIVGKIDWKPSMTRQEADAWAKESAYRDPLYHGTQYGHVQSIQTKGFDVGRKADWGRAWGDGVYATPHEELAIEYTRGFGKVLELKINVKRPLRVTVDPEAWAGIDKRQILLDGLSPLERAQGARVWDEVERKLKTERYRLEGILNRRIVTEADKLAAWDAQKLLDDLPSSWSDAPKINALLDELGYDSIVLTSLEPITIDAVGGTQIVVRNARQVVVII